MNDGRPTIRSVLVPLLLLLALLSLVGLARRDRYLRPHPPLEIDDRTIRLPTPPLPAGLARAGHPPVAADIPAAAAELEQSAAEAEKARAGLDQAKRDIEKLRAELDRKQKDLEGASADAEARRKAAEGKLAATQVELEAKRVEMEKAAQDADDRLARARRELEQLEAQRVAAAAQAAAARGLGRGPRLDMQVAADPRRVRNPALPPFIPNDAAVAAAGAGRPPAGGPAGGGAPGGATATGTVVNMRGPLFSTTATGDILQGQAARIEAEGQYALDTSKAVINAQTARAMGLDNHIRTAETFFEARRINRMNRAFEAGPAVTLGQVIRLAAANLPPRPTNLQLDAATGDITWPRLLLDPTYEDQTARIQRYFHDRLARGGSFDFESAEDCATAFAELVGLMRDNVYRYPTGAYGAAKTFVDGLRREYDQPVDE